MTAGSALVESLWIRLVDFWSTWESKGDHGRSNPFVLLWCVTVVTVCYFQDDIKEAVMFTDGHLEKAKELIKVNTDEVSRQFDFGEGEEIADIQRELQLASLHALIGIAEAIASLEDTLSQMPIQNLIEAVSGIEMAIPT